MCNLQTTAYLDRRYCTASYSEAGRCRLGTELRVIVHSKRTLERTCLDHRHPSASDIRMRTSVRIHTSAIALRILKQLLPLYIISVEETRLLTPCGKRTTHSLKTKRVALWVFPSKR